MPSKIFKSGSPPARNKSIRGKISAPIPIASTVDDDEFPIRNPGTGIATAVPIDAEELRRVQEQLQLPQHVTKQQKEAAMIGRAMSVVDIDTPEAAPEQATPRKRAGTMTSTKQSTSEEASKRASEVASQSSPLRARRQQSTLSGTQRFSTISATPTANTRDSSKPQRKKSTLRSALGRLFGRKKHRDSQGSGPEADRKSALTMSSQQQSMPQARNRSRERNGNRAMSMPVNEFDRALRSHSVGPEEIAAIKSARNSAQLEMAHAGHTREKSAPAIISSHLFTRPRGEGEEWAGLSPRPASAHGRGSRYTEGSDNPEDIGVALTHDMSGNILQSRRRSRSLGGLLGDAGPQDTRRRSDEIRYWRESYGAPPLSPSTAAETAEEYPEEEDDAPRLSYAGIPQRPRSVTPTESPPQPLMIFGLAQSNDQVATLNGKSAERHERDNSVEARLQRLERVLDKLYLPSQENGTVAQSVFGHDREARLGPAAALKPAFGYSQAHQSARLSIYQASLLDIPTPTEQKSDFLEPAAPKVPGSRVSSGSTVRPAASMPAMNNPDLGDSPANLLAQLQIERCARQGLEVEVKRLSDRVNSLSTTLFAVMRGHDTSKATPTNSRSQPRPVITTDPLTPPQQHGEEDIHTPKTPAAVTPSRLAPLRTLNSTKTPSSEFDVDDDDSDGGSEILAAAAGGNESEIDVYETPAEETVAYGGKHGYRHVEDDEDKENIGVGGRNGDKGIRVMSLSQMTLGRGA